MDAQGPEAPRPKSHVRRGRKRLKRYFGRVYERNGNWCVRLRRKGVDVHEVVGPDKSLAEARLAAIQKATVTEHALGVRTVASCTWAEFWPSLKDWLKANHGETTLAAELGRARVVEEHLGTTPLVSVRRGDVEAFLTNLRNQRKCAPATLNRYRAFLSVAFQRAIESGFARENPTKGIKGAKEQSRPVPYLDAETLDAVLARAEGDVRPFLTLATDTGCRRSELLRLTWADVDLKDGAITVRRSKNRDARRIPLMPRALDVLRALAAKRPARPVAGSGRVFSELNGETDPSKVSKAWALAAKRAGFPGLRLHDARHAYASGLARAGIAPGVIGTLIGDRTPSVVFRYSRHAPRNAEVLAVEALAAARGQCPGKGTEGQIQSA